MQNVMSKCIEHMCSCTVAMLAEYYSREMLLWLVNVFIYDEMRTIVHIKRF